MLMHNTHLDFDISKQLEGKMEAMTVAGTPQYTAPEVISSDKEGYSIQADIYSFGMLLYEIITLKVPYYDADPRRLHHLVTQGVPPTVPTDIANDASRAPLLEIMNVCLKYEPTARPVAEQLIEKISALGKK